MNDTIVARKITLVDKNGRERISLTGDDDGPFGPHAVVFDEDGSQRIFVGMQAGRSLVSLSRKSRLPLVAVGEGDNGSAEITLYRDECVLKIRIVVDSCGVPVIQFFDDDGNVTKEVRED